MQKFVEQLGTISTEALLQNVVTDEDSATVDAIRLAFPDGFDVSAEMETVPAQTDKEKRLVQALFQLARNHDEILDALRSNKKFVRLILEPKS